MSAVRGIIFDCDGVLFDSRRANLAYYSLVLQHFGEPPLTEENGRVADVCHTYASDDVYRLLLGEERVEEARAFAATIDWHVLMDLMVPEKGVPQVLERLAEQMALALATNRGASVRTILDHFDMARYFQKVVTSKDVSRPKPAPEMLLLAVRELGLRKDEVWYVGDSELDRQAAEAAGLRFVAYKGAVEGDLAIRDHGELISLLGLC